jgi:hypothetical protein
MGRDNITQEHKTVCMCKGSRRLGGGLTCTTPLLPRISIVLNCESPLAVSFLYGLAV